MSVQLSGAIPISLFAALLASHPSAVSASVAFRFSHPSLFHSILRRLLFRWTICLGFLTVGWALCLCCSFSRFRFLSSWSRAVRVVFAAEDFQKTHMWCASRRIVSPSVSRLPLVSQEPSSIPFDFSLK